MKPELRYANFDTPIGACAIVWGDHGIVRVRLPGQSPPDATEARPTVAVRRATRRIAALLRGEPDDLRSIPLDMDGVGPFARRVYEAARAIPPGRTATYGEIARRVGSPRSARAVGQALGRNPFALVVPCHRVLGASGALCGFSARGGTAVKRRLLAIEAPPAR